MKIVLLGMELQKTASFRLRVQEIEVKGRNVGLRNNPKRTRIEGSTSETKDLKGSKCTSLVDYVGFRCSDGFGNGSLAWKMPGAAVHWIRRIYDARRYNL